MNISVWESNWPVRFALVGALSVVRFRNAIKETRDVGFIFLVMGIGMACGTRFYSLAVLATIVICAVILVMHRFSWFALDVQRQVVKLQVPADGEDGDPGREPGHDLPQRGRFHGIGSGLCGCRRIH